MGNRCVITTAPYKPTNLGIYLHWDGGQESVEGFLNACRQLNYRCPSLDSYGWVGLAFAIGLFFKYDGLSIGIDQCKRLDTDNGDNGTWLITNWEIVGNKFGDKPAALLEPERAKRDSITEAIINRACKVRGMGDDK